VIILAINTKPVKKLAAVVVAMLLSFLVLQTLDLLSFPSYFGFSISPEGEILHVEYYTYFQLVVMYLDHSFGISLFMNIGIYGVRQYVGIPIAAAGAIYILVRWRDPAKLLDKDHARHMLLLGYLLLIVKVIPYTVYFSSFQLIVFFSQPSGGLVPFLLFSFLPQLAYISFSLVSVISLHATLARISRGVI
jgi:hypothetical protein